MAEVERGWFRRRFAGQDVLKCYQSDDEPDGDFDGAVADQLVVEEAWSAWREEVAFAEQFVRDTDLGFAGHDGAGNPISLRELLVRMIEEYARHNGRADLFRERIDGRVGQEGHRPTAGASTQLILAVPQQDPYPDTLGAGSGGGGCPAVECVL